MGKDRKKEVEKEGGLNLTSGPHQLVLRVGPIGVSRIVGGAFCKIVVQERLVNSVKRQQIRGSTGSLMIDETCTCTAKR
jgi:hypothetical protein